MLKKRTQDVIDRLYRWKVDAEPQVVGNIRKIPADAQPKITRPPAEYSNTSPWGIAKKYQTLNNQKV